MQITFKKPLVTPLCFPVARIPGVSGFLLSYPPFKKKKIPSMYVCIHECMYSVGCWVRGELMLTSGHPWHESSWVHPCSPSWVHILFMSMCVLSCETRQINTYHSRRKAPRNNERKRERKVTVIKYSRLEKCQRLGWKMRPSLLA